MDETYCYRPPRAKDAVTSPWACPGSIGHELMKAHHHRLSGRDFHVTYRVRRSQVPGASSPLSRAVLAGPPRKTLVLATFPTALYLSAGRHHEVLPVLASDALMLPTGTRLSAPGRDIVWGVGPGDSVTVGDGGIALPGWRIRLVREWRPARVHIVSGLAEPELLSELADSLSHHASAPGLVDQASAVCRAARRGDDAGVSHGVRHLLGAGEGLTPSGDDVLCAVLLVLGGLGDAAAVTLLGEAVQEQWAHTTSLSASLLDAARSGYAVPQVAALVGSSLGGNLTGVSESLTSTLAIGHSSGRDLVAGVAGSLSGFTQSRPNTRPAPFQAVNTLETVPKQCSERSLTHPCPLQWRKS
jgi:Protein of unknown function (DUF2877)